MKNKPEADKAYLADLIMDLRGKGYTIEAAENAVKDVLTAVDNQLIAGKEVVATGHGTYYLKQNKPRQIPGKPKGTLSPSSVTVGYKASVPLKAKLNNKPAK